MKCALCNQRKGKRSCPAKGELICAQCCGEKRVLEIMCPETCEYLKVGRDHEIKEYGRYLRRIDPSKHEVRQRALHDNQEVIAHLELSLARERLSTRDLTDRSVAEALDLLLEAYRTEDNGILYEKTANDLQVESLRRTLRGVVESHRNPEEQNGEGIVGSQAKRLALQSAIGCLEFVRALVASHMDTSESATSYVDLLARIIPRDESSSTRSSSIIIP